MAWDKLDAIFAKIENSRLDGIRIDCDRYPYTASFTGLARLTKAWSAANPGHTVLDGLSCDPKGLQACVTKALEEVGGADRVVFAPLEPMKDIDGRTLQEVIEEKRQEPYQVVAELVARGGVSCMWIAMLEENLQRILKKPYVMVASDGHLRVFGKGVSHLRNYGTFPRVFARYCREENLLTLGEAIAKCTSMPAAKFGINQRGMIKQGWYADLVLFDAETIADTATFQDNHRYCVGIPYVIVNGRFAVDESMTTSAGYGRIITP